MNPFLIKGVNKEICRHLSGRDLYTFRCLGNLQLEASNEVCLDQWSTCDITIYFSVYQQLNDLIKFNNYALF